MIVFETNSRQALIAGLRAATGFGLGMVFSIVLILVLPISLITYLLITLFIVMLGCLAWLGYHLFALVNTSYAIDRNAFVVRWGPIRVIVPMGDVQRVIAAADIADELHLRRIPLPHWWIGHGKHPALGTIYFYSNAPLDQQVVVVTPEASYAISPSDREGFLEAFRVRFKMGPTQAVHYARLAPAIMNWSLWQDHMAHLLMLIAVGLNSVLFALSFARYPVLQDQVVLHFDPLGAADRLGPRGQVFGPALISLLLFLVNFLLGLLVYWRGEKLAAYLAWGGSAAVQLLFLVATITVAFTV